MEEVVADVVAVAEGKKRRHAPYDRIFFFVGGGGWRAQPTTRLRPRSQEELGPENTKRTDSRNCYIHIE